VLGQAIEKALGDKRGIARYGSATVPMDESLASVTVDLSGRPAFVFNVTFSGGTIGNFAVELVEEFLKALATSARMNLHVNVPYGTNNHHIAEAAFKAAGPRAAPRRSRSTRGGRMTCRARRVRSTAEPTWTTPSRRVPPTQTDYPGRSPPFSDSSASATSSCPGCGYNVRNLTSDRCPECGEQLQHRVFNWRSRRQAADPLPASSDSPPAWASAGCC
jgi:hypothetical protein